jgi:biopolymer transport protein ExbD
LEIDLPEATGKVGQEDKTVLEVVINSKGEYSVNERPLINNQADTLSKAVMKIAEGNNKLPFIITADAKTPHEFVVRAMDVAGKLGFVHLSITTQKTGPAE